LIIKLLFLSSESDLSCQLPGELELVPDQLHVMDGNNSMKQVDGSGHSDECAFLSDYLIPPSMVDNFKDDVVTCPGTQAQPSQALPFGNENTLCTNNWTVVNTVSEGTVKVFQQTGGFLSTCCHSIVETLIEM
jgi:Kyakuja-Dileera-Zisupton transposase